VRKNLSSIYGAVLIASALLLSRAASAAEEGYRPEKDTRPVREDKLPAGHSADDGHDHSAQDDDKGPLELPFPELKGTLNYDTIQMLAIQEGGRKKPLSTYIFEQMEQLVGRPIFSSEPYVKDKLSKEPRKVGAADLFFSIWLSPDEWRHAAIILVADAGLKEALGFELKESHFSFLRLAKSSKLKELVDAGMARRHKGDDKDMTGLEKEAEIIGQRMQLMFNIMSASRAIKMVPHPDNANGRWYSLKEFEESYSDEASARGEERPERYYPPEKYEALRVKYNAFAQAFHDRNEQQFSNASQELRTELVNLSPVVYPKYSALEREVTYNQTRPFGKAWVLYFFAAVFGLVALKVKSKPLYFALMGFYLGGLGLHIYGFALRCLIAGRPPVSNMYESVIWVGFGAVFFGLIFELIYKKGIFALSGAVGGFLCLVLMDLLPAVMGNPNMPGAEAGIKPLQPVLRDNFWLTVHVLTITLSYAAFLLAWVLGHVTLAKHLFEPGAKKDHHELHQFVYRAVQVGVLLLSIGTILGGVWAYYSWGRFWGWDPKETWAFIALMCYLVVLHGRFTGWWGNFGMSVGSVLCFQAVVMAWYGVNFVLGSGLHAYGSGAGGLEYSTSRRSSRWTWFS
jgi:ABC-type transport system involved in cytochrome c biogenesis permease subunit